MGATSAPIDRVQAPTTGAVTDDWLYWTWAGWEPDRAYRRQGRASTRYFGRGAWIDAWRARVVSDDTLRWLAELGVNAVITHCYKGFGLTTEADERERLQQFVARAHDRQIRVWGYVQAGSLYYESLLAEQPDAEDWAARHHDGSLQTWGGSYYRWRPCLSSDAYLTYMARVLDDAIAEIGLDGVHLDNSYYRHCWCDRCAQAFRDWLGRRPDLDLRLGLTNADHVRPPPMPEGQERYSDPLQLLWMEFGVQQRLTALQRLRAVAKARRSDAVFVTNAAFPRRSIYKAQVCVDPARESSVSDITFAETGNLPRFVDGCLVSQAEAYLFADAGDYRVVSSAWQPGPRGAEPPGTAAGIWTALAEEYSYHAVIPGNNWLLRAAGDGDRLLADDAPARAVVRETTAFFHELARKFPRNPARQWGELGIVIEPDTLTLAWSSDRAAWRAVVIELLRRRIPAVVLFPDTPIPPFVRTLLVAQQTCLPDAQLTRTRAFARQPGCTVIVAGASGRSDEWHIPRDESVWQQWRQSDSFVADAGDPVDWLEEATARAYMGTDLMTSTPACRQAFDELLVAPAYDPQLRVLAPDGVLINCEVQPGERLLIHVRDQRATGGVVDDVRLVVADSLLAGRTVSCYHAAEPSAALAVATAQPDASAETAGCRVFAAPAFQHYLLVVITP
jgi:hypothetical protein